VEFINVAKDDVLAWPVQARRSYPSTVNARMESTIAPFVKKSLAVSNALLDVLSDKLELPKGALLKKHPRDQDSGCATRSTLSPPIAARQVISAHTGSSFFPPHWVLLSFSWPRLWIPGILSPI
jgi:hypothetical protein